MRIWTFLTLALCAWGKNLEMVIEIAREGLRTPRKTDIAAKQGIFLEEYNDTLSEYGKQQQYLLGLEMRVRYNDSVLEGECNPLSIFGYSVSKESVMLSGQVQLFGICPLYSNKNITPELVEKSYPPFDFPTRQKIADELGLFSTPYNFLPLPLHSAYNDPVFGRKDYEKCPLPSSNLEDSQREKIIDKAFHDSLYNYLAKLTGKDVSKFKASKVIHTVEELLYWETLGKLPIVKKKMVRAAKRFVRAYYSSFWNSKEKKQYSSMFFNELMQKLKNRVAIKLSEVLHEKAQVNMTIEQADYDPKQLRFYLYEVTDKQMYPYLEALQFGFKDYVQPSSILLFELHQECQLNPNMNLFDAMSCFKLDITYNDEPVNSALCGKNCKLSSFYKGLKQYFGDNLKV